MHFGTAGDENKKNFVLIINFINKLQINLKVRSWVRGSARFRTDSLLLLENTNVYGLMTSICRIQDVPTESSTAAPWHWPMMSWDAISTYQLCYGATRHT